MVLFQSCWFCMLHLCGWFAWFGYLCERHSTHTWNRKLNQKCKITCVYMCLCIFLISFAVYIFIYIYLWINSAGSRHFNIRIYPQNVVHIVFIRFAIDFLFGWDGDADAILLLYISIVKSIYIFNLYVQQFSLPVKSSSELIQRKLIIICYRFW